MRGESFGMHLTTTLRVPWNDSDTAFYRRLRRIDPAPYAALLRFDGLTVHCSSPERFLRVTPDGRVESRPVKGTARRDPDPARDAHLAASLARTPHTRADHLMAVDLVRNDLGQVCETGSIRVERYMTVESRTTAHHLVSSVQGRLKPAVTPLECARHCFPGGSVTGSPKKRTMEILDRLETEARGVYSGALGYFGLGGGADLNVAVRTAVRQDDTLTIGLGSAVGIDSASDDKKYEAMLREAIATLQAGRPPDIAKAW
ncbi:anthranilate synthase component I family protein [Streptomyces sp. NPDC021093]|uniref:anthranilate synthase component I family protein n=1 Tax=Streptomyces sp. NPDC021093 TaxID=3365112 RepID=UPI0037B5AF4F